jgi:hypothetical protein
MESGTRRAKGGWTLQARTGSTSLRVPKCVLRSVHAELSRKRLRNERQPVPLVGM